MILEHQKLRVHLLKLLVLAQMQPPKEMESIYSYYSEFLSISFPA